MVSKQKSNSKFLRALGFIINKIWLLFAFLIIAIACLLLLIKLFLPEINHYKSEIVDFIENQYQIDIEVGSITAHWASTGPVIVLKDFSVVDKSKVFNIIDVGSLSFELDLLTSLINREYSTQSVLLKNTNVRFYIDSDLGVKLSKGNINNAGLQNTEQLEESSKRLFELLTAQKKVEIINSKLELKTLNGTSFNYLIDGLSIKKYGNKHQLVGSLVQKLESTKDSNHIDLVIEVMNTDVPEKTYTKVYVEADKLMLSSIPKIGTYFDKNLEDTQSSIKLWGRWHKRHWQKVDAQISLQHEKALKVNMSWENNDYHHGYASIHDITIKDVESELKQGSVKKGITDSNQLAKDSYFLFKYTHEEKQKLLWNLLVKDEELGVFIEYFSKFISMDNESVAWLKNNKFKVNLEHLKVDFVKNKFGWKSRDLSVSFSELKMNRMKNIPVFQELKGWLFKGEEDKAIQAGVNTDSSELYITPLFRETIPIDHFELDFQFKAFEDESIVWFNHIDLKNEDLKLDASAKLLLNDKTQLSVLMNLSEGSAKNTRKYLPVGIMSDQLVKYLDSSILSGNLFNTTAVLRGPLESFPYAGDKNVDGVFIVDADLDDAKYRFLPKWPIANNVKANLLFDSEGMFIDIFKGISLQNEINSAKVSIADMLSKQSMLNISLDINSADNKGKNYLRETPLKFISDGIDLFDFSGLLNVNLDIGIPLNKKSKDKKLNLTGFVQPVEKNYSFSLPFLQVNSVNGKLAFNENGIKKSHLKALVNKNIINADISSINELNDVSKQHKFLKIDLSGIFDSHLVDNFVDGKWSSFIDGNSDFKSQLVFSSKPITDKKHNRVNDTVIESITEVGFQSDLKGVSVNMPGFLNKSNSAAENLNLQLKFSSGLKNDYHLGYFDWNGVNANWYVQGGSGSNRKNNNGRGVPPKYSANISINEKVNLTTKEQKSSELFNMQNFDEKGIDLTGKIDSIDSSKWIEFISKIKDNYQSSDLKDNLANTVNDRKEIASQSRDYVNERSNNRNNSRWLINKIDLSIGNLKIKGIKDLTDITLTADKYDGLPWRAGIDSELNKIDVIFDQNSQWLVNAPKINMSLLATKQVSKPKLGLNNIDLSENSQLRPTPDDKEKTFSIYSSLSDMDIYCGLCKVNEIVLGEVKASIRTEEKDSRGLSLKANVSNGKNHHVALNAFWSMKRKEDFITKKENRKNQKTEFEEETKLNFILSTDNAGKLLKNWGVNPSIEDSKGYISSELSWFNSPWDIDYSKIRGSAEFSLGKGYLSDISDENGRILTLFDFRSILRKLTFDFKDVYKKGFFYDSMRGTLELADGTISTYNTNVKGNVADVWLFGETDLVNKNFDQHVIVSPHITSSFPVLAAWALEPTTGIIVYLLNKIMEPAINVATQIDYLVTGNFDKPIVTEIKKSSKKVKVSSDEVKQVKKELDTFEKEIENSIETNLNDKKPVKKNNPEN